MASSRDEWKKMIKELLDEMMNETSTSAGAGGYMTPNAFTGGKSANEKKRNKVATMLGMKLATTKKNDREDKAGLMEHTSDNETQAGYMVKTAFSDGRASDKVHLKKTSTVLGYQLHPSVQENFVNTDDELLNEELEGSDVDSLKTGINWNKEIKVDLPSAKDEIKVDLPESSHNGDEFYKGFWIDKTHDGKFYCSGIDDTRKFLSLSSIKDVIDNHIVNVNDQDDRNDPYARAEREEAESMSGIREAEITRKIQIDPATKLPITTKTSTDMANIKPTQKGKVGGKDIVIDTDKNGNKVAQQVKIVSQK